MEKLTKQEEDVMLQIWQLGSCNVREVLAVMPEPQPPYTTLASIVQNLKKKGYVRQSRNGNTYQYSPIVKECDYKRIAMGSFVHDYFRNSFKDMVSFFVKDEKLSADDLHDIISEIEKKQTE
jgi:BlaI family penicillinase repressor